jgi:small subunit ribosomal protein S9
MTENHAENANVEAKPEARHEVRAEGRPEPKQPAPKPLAPGNKSKEKYGYWWGTGRRKTAVARVRIRPGSGKLIVNKKELDDFFTREQDRKAVVAPLKTVHAEKAFDIFINVKGGGTTGQAGAALLGVARALRSYDENYIQALRDGGHLTRDPRMVERKKPGQSGARRRFQFSKR